LAGLDRSSTTCLRLAPDAFAAVEFAAATTVYTSAHVGRGPDSESTHFSDAVVKNPLTHDSGIRTPSTWCRVPARKLAKCAAASIKRLSGYMAPSDWVPLGVSGAGRVPSWRRRTNTLPTASLRERSAAFGSPSFGGIVLGKFTRSLCSVNLSAAHQRTRCRLVSVRTVVFRPAPTCAVP
jgi:hypothetical protein